MRKGPVFIRIPKKDVLAIASDPPFAKPLFSKGQPPRHTLHLAFMAAYKKNDKQANPDNKESYSQEKRGIVDIFPPPFRIISKHADNAKEHE